MIDGTPLSVREELRDLVRERYAQSARTVRLRSIESSGCCTPEAVDPGTVAAYDPIELRRLPQDAVLASLRIGRRGQEMRAERRTVVRARRRSILM